MNPDVFLSLLALDSYNRGYGQNVGGLTNSGMIGNATILRQSNITENSDEVQAGFYAIAYQWQGQTVISYRGTNFPKAFSPTELYQAIDKDIGEGWSIFTGLGPNSQPRLAQEFDRAITVRDCVDSPDDPHGYGVNLTGRFPDERPAANDNAPRLEGRTA